MNQFPADLEPDIESELIDLHAVSMTALRDLDGTLVKRALRQVMQRTAHPPVADASSERID